jgi:serine/threonine-protein kinase
LLTPGTRIGPYEVVSPLGAGAMGDVYRARDTRLDRDVAIKVSTTEFSERFSREARSIAALNHSNVCHLYDVGPNYLVLEYVEGETLAGPMSFDEALPIIRQLIDGIEAAHDKNIIHRDLKTANIKMPPEGSVKILDFGLAKATEPDSIGDLANSPTFTMGATQAGVILGTAAYMPPEQAKGKAADRRSDIWSFGVVVYELLTGRTPFQGETAVEILGSVMNKEPDWSPVPPRAQRLLRWCLQKDRRKRLAAIGDARMLLEESDAIVQSVVSEPRSKRVLWRITAVVLMLGASVTAYGWWRATRPVERSLIRLNVDLGREAVIGPRITAVLSPDGTRIVFTGRGTEAGTRQLFTRRLDQPVATPLSGTESPVLQHPFFSPDGEWIGFFVANRIMKVAAQGGGAVVVGEFTGGAAGASWGDDGNIILGGLTGLARIAAAGGAPQLIRENSGVQVFPDVLPGARAVLFNTNATGLAPGDLSDLVIAVTALETGETKTLIRGGYWPRYLKTGGDTGHLLYVSDGTLFGVRFDPNRLEILGTPVPLLADLAAGSSISAGGGQFAFSDTGTFVYLTGKADQDTYPVLWLDAAGTTMALIAQPGLFVSPRLSPDGKRLVYTTAAGGQSWDVWVYDVERDAPTQLTFTGIGGREIAWAPDSKHIVFGDGSGMWWLPADGSGQPQRILDKMLNPRPTSFAPDGRLAFSPAATSGLPDVWTIPLDLSDPARPKPGKAEPFLNEQHVEVDPAFSPDGKFLAYASNESGREELFVRPFPGPGGRWKVSIEGGKFPAWSRATRELFFLGGDDRIMVVSYTTQENTFSPGRPQPWSPTPVRRTGTLQNFDVSSDGKRVVAFPQSPESESDSSVPVAFLLNFFDDVRRRIP